MAAGGEGGGVPTKELNCFDGLDDDLDGAIDCGDSDCEPGYECVPIAPSGSGPYVRISLTTGEAMPAACPLDGSQPTIRGITPAPPACTACECNVSNVNCRSEVISTYAVPDCAGTPQMQQANSECAMLQQPVLSGSIKVSRGQITGTVAPSVATKTPEQPWKDVVQVCPAYGAATGGGCATGQFCVPRARVPYESYMCVHAPGDVSCNGEYGRKLVAYDSAQDSRGCTQCGCNANIQCSGYLVKLDSGGTCNSGMGPSIAFDACTNTMAETRSVQLGMLSWQVVNTNIWGGQPTGGVSPMNQRSFCCTQ